MKRLAIAITCLAMLPISFVARSSERFAGTGELAAMSDVVVRAKVLGSRGEIEHTPDGDFPFLLYNLQTLEKISGNCPDRFVVLATGMRAGDTILPMPDGPALFAGAEVILFLKADGEGRYYPVSPTQAVLAVLPPRNGEGETLVAVPVKGGAETGRSVVLIKLPDFVGQVKATIENQKREESEK